MPPLGRIIIVTAMLGLIGLGVAMAIGAVIVIVLVAASAAMAWFIYKRVSARFRLRRLDL